MQIEYATVFIGCKQLLLYEPLRETPITQNLLCRYWKKKPIASTASFFDGILETLGQDHDSILALLL